MRAGHEARMRAINASNYIRGLLWGGYGVWVRLSFMASSHDVFYILGRNSNSSRRIDDGCGNEGESDALELAPSCDADLASWTGWETFTGL